MCHGCAVYIKFVQLLGVAVMLFLVSGTAGELDPWPAMLARTQRARSSAIYKYMDEEVPVDESFRTMCLSQRFCECTMSAGYNRTFWLNTGSAFFNSQLYVAILQKTVSLQAVAHYRQINKTVTYPVFEANTIIFCKAKILDTLKLHLEDCKIVEPWPSYKEKHPCPLRSRRFELNGLIDPRLITASDTGGLFLQAGCRPKHLSDDYNNNKFHEGPCLVKLLDGVSTATTNSTSHGVSTATTSGTSQMLIGPLVVSGANSRQKEGLSQAALPTVPDALLPGVTMRPADWRVGEGVFITHASGLRGWEKNWVPFSYQGTLLWSRHLMPHQVVTVHANGTASTLYRVENTEVFKTVKTVCGNGPRGNTPAVLLSPEESGLPRPVYLNILHYTPLRHPPDQAPGHLNRNCQDYTNFFYLMDSEPPFNILEVARPPIPLVSATNVALDSPPLVFGMGYISFPTGLVILNKKVVITYGSGDSQLRIFRVALSDVLNTFSHTWITNPPNTTLLQGDLKRKHGKLSQP